MRLLVTGGGTGGHIYPAVEIANAMKEILPRTSVLFVGTSSGMEKDIVSRTQIPFQTIRSAGIVGKSPLNAIKGAFSASLGIADSMSVIRTFRPDVVIGTGGYVSGPMVLAAKFKGIPCAIQEQNVVPGKTNQLLSRITHKTFCAWADSAGYFSDNSKVVVMGNPVRKELFSTNRHEAAASLGLLPDKPTLLFMGGSRGARTLVKAGQELALRLPSDYQMILLTGTRYYQETVELAKAGHKPGIEGAITGNIIIRPYTHDMAAAYNISDLVVARAGGMTLSEITAFGIPGVIVPSPNVTGNHQFYNAQVLEKAGAALLIHEDKSVVENVVGKTLALISDNNRLPAMSMASKKLGQPHAAANICRELIALAKTRR